MLCELVHRSAAMGKLTSNLLAFRTRGANHGEVGASERTRQTQRECRGSPPMGDHLLSMHTCSN